MFASILVALTSRLVVGHPFIADLAIVLRGTLPVLSHLAAVAFAIGLYEYIYIYGINLGHGYIYVLTLDLGLFISCNFLWVGSSVIIHSYEAEREAVKQDGHGHVSRNN